jgi:hypothetical protein
MNGMNDKTVDICGEKIEGFNTAEDVANFLLHEAFHHIHQAAAYAVASDLFGERILEIEPDPTWKTPDLPAPTTLKEWIEQREETPEDILDPATLTRLSEAWLSSKRDALTAGRRILKKQQLRSVSDIVGHVVNLTLCLEAVLNRQLFFLRESGQLAPELYNFIDRAELMPKLLFCFKEEIVEKRLQVSRIKQLVGFRNRFELKINEMV